MNYGKVTASTLTAVLMLGMVLFVVPNAEAASNHSLTVKFNYASQGESLLYPCQGAYVELWAEIPNGEQVQANGYTDENGMIKFDRLPTGSYAASILASDSATVSVIDYNSSAHTNYQWRTDWGTIDASSIWVWDITSEDRGAWAAYDAIRSGKEWLSGKVDWSRSMVKVNWPTEDWPHSHGDSIDIPASTKFNAPIWDDEVILHEYAHCIQYETREGGFPVVEELDSHYIDTESSGSFAFVEGWAEFFAQAVTGNPITSGLTNIESTTYADGPLHNGDYGDWDGNSVEGAVASVIWDILDGNSSTDYPSWDTTGCTGDQVNDRFSIFWKIFLEQDPDEMDQVWNLWEPKDEALAEIFRHARFNKELDPPMNPENWFLSDHEAGVWSNDSSVTIGWTEARDNGSGIAGYSIIWSQDPDEVPDTTVDSIGTYIEKHLTAGKWYLHVRAIDNSGNAAEGATHFGPFLIAEGAVDVAADTMTTELDPVIQLLILIALAAFAILMVALVAHLVRKPRPEDLVPPPPRFSSYYYPQPYQQYPPNYPQYPPVYQQYPPPGHQQYPPPIQPQVQYAPPPPIMFEQARFCRNCGKAEMGGTYCPYCGYKLR